MLNIQYISNAAIDRILWDECINISKNGLIFATSIFLDNTCEWDALITPDYSYVMPLPFRKKFGIKYIYTPTFIPQLGVFSTEKITESVVIEFIKTIPQTFKFIEYNINEKNYLPNPNPDFTIRDRKNFILELDKPYESIKNNYSKDAKRNLTKCYSLELRFEENIGLEKVFELYHNAYGNLNKATITDEYNKLKHLAHKLIGLKHGFTIGVKNKIGEVIAGAFFTIYNNRITYLLGAPNEEGRTMRATHFLIDEVIKKYANSNNIFDFEGSDIENVANFYKKFSPTEKKYQHIKINRLPYLLKLFKK